MAASFRQWEKDPFFSAADEVQESADRYRIFRRFLFFFLEFDGVLRFLFFHDL